MALLLHEYDVAALLKMDEVLTAVESGFRSLGEGRAVNRPRSRASTAGGSLQVLHAAVPDLGVMGVKTYATTARGAQFLAILYRMDDGEALAIVEADTLGQIRTGAASGVATKYLARPQAGALGVIGTGWQARSQVQAIARVRPVALAKVYSRSAERREAFAAEMVSELGVEVVAVDSAQEAVEDTDIVVTATNTRTPVLQGAWLRPGMHVNAVGSNAASRQEIDVEAVRRAAIVAADSLEQARIECGDLIAAAKDDPETWDRVTELGSIVSGRAAGRTDDHQITLFESQGIAMEDVVTMELLYRRAIAAGAGQQIPLSRAPVKDRREPSARHPDSKGDSQ